MTYFFVIKNPMEFPCMALSLQWLLWCRFSPWPGNFHISKCCRYSQKKKKKKNSLNNFLLFSLKIYFFLCTFARNTARMLWKSTLSDQKCKIFKVHNYVQFISFDAVYFFQFFMNILFKIFLSFVFFIGLYPQHMEVPKLWVKPEL